MNDTSDKKLDDLLRSAFSGPLADDGFSARVLRALPPRRRQRPWLVPCAALVGGMLAWLVLLPSPLLQQAAREWLAGGIGFATVSVCALSLVVSLLGCGWALEEGQ